MNPFITLGLSEGLANVVKNLGFDSPTPIQEEIIPVLLSGYKDCIALAQTGTGKTAAFGLPLIENVDADSRETQALILAPTRELCVQVAKDLDTYARGYKNLNIVPVYGGASITVQIKSIRKGGQIIVATPGRLIDLITRKAVNLSTIKYLVLDEADEMLNMGFKEDIDRILSQSPDRESTWLFSATMPSEVSAIAKNYMTDPHEATMGEKNASNISITHQYAVVNDRNKVTALERMLRFQGNVYALVFCRTKIETGKVAERLMQAGINADALHGDLSQAQRDQVMRKFRTKAISVLVATDVAARGLDVKGISHVFHLNFPDEIAFYNHRSGRTGRAGAEGISIAIINPGEQRKVKRLETTLRTKFEKINVPTWADMAGSMVAKTIAGFHNLQPLDPAMEGMVNEVSLALSGMTREDLIRGIIAGALPEVTEQDMDVNNSSVGAGKSDSFHSDTDMERFFVNLGKMDGFEKGDILTMICQATEIGKRSIGRINLKGAYTFFEVDTDAASRVIAGMEGLQYRGRDVRVEKAGKEPPRDRARAPKGRTYSKRRSF